MNWGDVPAWGALTVAILAAVFSGVALKHSRESAAAAKKSAEAAERSAAADEATLAEMRREASERREAEAEAARPRPALKVERVATTRAMGVRGASVRYILRNAGTGPAVNVTTVQAGEPGQSRSMPFGVSLRPGEGHEFEILSAAQLPRLTAIRVKWDGQDEPVALPIPA
ncbi:hypothetical protein OHB05_39035 [Streptomyces sp. NBC_00638]|uniref:hypothetical protein n=1 Tax=unclassified Streptomyces TaxID=2593676 RepID=UPI00224F7FD7|nr:hypothetical protein [Streptomyces sp. NBC_00638]MCX5008552.1 hypothetical protein [Streptomyces sp. NBC_00638]